MNTTTTSLPILLNTTQGMILNANTMALGGSLLAIDFCIILFNILTIMVIVRFRTKNAVDIFVLTLALHDLAKGLVPVPITVYVYFSDWRIDEGKPFSLIRILLFYYFICRILLELLLIAQPHKILVISYFPIFMLFSKSKGHSKENT